MDCFDREESYLCDQLESGEISREEFDGKLRELHRSYREEAEKSAQKAYDDELARW